MVAENRKIESGWLIMADETKKELFYELNTLLKGLDKYFYSENLQYSHDTEPININYYNHLYIVRDVIFRVIWILELIMPQDKRNLYWFQKFAESRLLDDNKRDHYREALLSQDTPEESFYLLYDSFVHLKGLVSDLLKSGYISYISFLNFGRFITKEIRNNIYFNPFKKRFNPTVDRITNPTITRVIKGIDDKKLQKEMSVNFLYLFRFLRYLKYVGSSSRHAKTLSISILILILIRSEINSLRNYMDTLNLEDDSLHFVIRSISYQLSIESKRVYMQELRDIFEKADQESLKGRIENSYGILKNLFEQCITQLAQYFQPGIKGEEIFESFATRLRQSLKLREDIAVLHFIITKLLDSPPDPDGRLKLFTSLNNFMEYFKSFTFELLRYEDYENFVKLFEEIALFNGSAILEEKKAEHFFRKLEHFRIFLETTMHHINNRAELSDKTMDEDKVRLIANQYL